MGTGAAAEEVEEEGDGGRPIDAAAAAAEEVEEVLRRGLPNPPVSGSRTTRLGCCGVPAPNAPPFEAGAGVPCLAGAMGGAGAGDAASLRLVGSTLGESE